MLDETLVDPDFKEMFEIEITDQQARDAVNLVETLVNTKGVTKLDPDTIKTFSIGALYGFALASRMATSVKDIDLSELDPKNNKDRKTLKKVIRKCVFVFFALSKGLENYSDDMWFANLMKNAKVSEPVKPKKQTK